LVVEQPSKISGFWAVPGNSFITPISENGQNFSVKNVTYSNGSELFQLSSIDRHLREGWRFENGSIHLSLLPGTTVNINFESGKFPDSVIIENDTFNGLVPLIVYGHHVTDLFEWSSGFQDSSIRFTWLIEPRPVTQMDWALPIMAVVVGIITIVQMRRLIQSDDPTPELYSSLFESE